MIEKQRGGINIRINGLPVGQWDLSLIFRRDRSETRVRGEVVENKQGKSFVTSNHKSPKYSFGSGTQVSQIHHYFGKEVKKKG